MLIYALGMDPWYGYFMGLEYSDDSEQIVQSSKMVDEIGNSEDRRTLTPYSSLP